MPKLLMTQADADADRARWLELRRGGVTASEIAAVLGIAPKTWTQAFRLYHFKTGELDDDGFQSEEMSFGTFAEPFVAERLARARPALVVGEGGLYAAYDQSWMMATFDRLLYEGPVDAQLGADFALAPGELKTAGSLEEWGSDPDDAVVPDHYRAQCYWQAAVGGYQVVFLAVMFRWSCKVVVYELPIDGDALADIAFMQERALAFLGRVEAGDPPPVDWTEDTTRALKRLHPDLEDRDVRVPRRLAARYRAAKRAKARHEERVGRYENELLAAMGAAKRATVQEVYPPDGTLGDVVVAERRKYETKRVSSALLRDRWPGALRDCQVTVPVDGLWPGPWALRK